MTGPTAPAGPPRPSSWTDGRPDLARWTFIAALAVAAVTYALLGRSQWFFQDEWVFLTESDGWWPRHALAPHNEHWTTLPRLVYRVLWNTVGARSYKPYQAISISLHLVVAALVRALASRMGAGPWLATASGVALLFYGAGSENVVWAFQMTFTGALALGLAQLLLADHPDPSRRRQLGALACGAGALMCSAAGLVMVSVVGIALLARRGLRAAAIQVVPLAILTLAWHSLFVTSDAPVSHDAGDIARFARTGLVHAVTRLGAGAAVAVALTVSTVFGLVLVAGEAPRTWAGLRQRLGLPLALVVGTVSFLLLSGASRVDFRGPGFATRGRYAYVLVTLLLPVAALGLDAIARRWRHASVPLVVLLLAGVPANLGAIEPRASSAASPRLVLTVANSSWSGEVPARTAPFGEVPGATTLTAGWLQDQVRNGRLPSLDVAEVAPDTVAEAHARLALLHPPGGAAGANHPMPGSSTCEPLPNPPASASIHLAAGEQIGLLGRITVVVVGEHGGRSLPRKAGSLEPRALVTTGLPVDLEITADPGPFPDAICR